jgi:hypothetical protein
MSAGGGVSDFTNESARDATKPAGSWEVRAIVGSRLPVAAEVSYLGSAQRISALGLESDALLVGNGVQGDLRLNIMPKEIVSPFVYGGAAWRRYDLARVNNNTSDVADHDNVIEFPVGIGLAYHYGGLMVDARGEFRAATNEDLMPALNAASANEQASLHRWGVNANLGFEF